VEPTAIARPDPGSTVHFTQEGAVEPGVVVSFKGPTRRWRRTRPRFVASPPVAPTPDAAANPTEFVRRVVVAEIQSMGQRLGAAHHYTTVQDLLELPAPTLRVLIWPKPGLLDREAGRALATMELVLEGEPAVLTASYWWGSRPQDVITMARLSCSDLTLDWTRARVLDFIQNILAQV
jgi:hypothetical protein